MDVIYLSRLKSHLNRRLETPNATIDRDNYIKILILVGEFVEQIKELGLMGPEKKQLVLSFYKRLIVDTVNEGVSIVINKPSTNNVYPTNNTINAQSEYIHFAENIAPQLLDSCIGLTKGQYFINYNDEATTNNVKSKINKYSKK